MTSTAAAPTTYAITGAPVRPGFPGIDWDAPTPIDVRDWADADDRVHAEGDTEFMTLAEPGNTESLTCVPGCGNQAHLDGFYGVYADGTPGIDCDQRWADDGYLVNCGSCGRVVVETQAALVDGDKRPVLRQLATPVNPNTML